MIAFGDAGNHRDDSGGRRESRALRWNGTSADARGQVQTAVSCVPPNRAFGSLRRVRCHFAAALTNHEGFHGKYRPSGIGKAEGNTDGGCKALTRDATCELLIALLFTPSRSLLLRRGRSLPVVLDAPHNLARDDPRTAHSRWSLAPCL